MTEPASGAAAVRDLASLVRFASVSSDPAHAADVRACAAWVARRCAAAGFARVSVLPGRRHPAVLAHHPAPPGRPTVLLYAHFDVQPPGPGWRTHPFVPVRRGPDLFARGASDDKGQLLAQVLGVQRVLRAGRLALGVVALFDGEEEIGSPALPELLARHVAPLRPAAAVVSDTRMLGPGRPSLTVGLRGSLAVELEISGPAHEIHAGQFGGAVHNPLQVLCEVLAALHDRHGRIAVPGLYAGVRPVGEPRPSPRSDAEILGEAGVGRGWGERGLTAYERTVARPALTFNGLSGGHAGPGGKSVIPPRGSAKLSFRLVDEQDPATVERLLRARLSELVPPTVGWRLERQGSALPVRLDPHDAVHRAAATACRRVWGRAPAILRSGGSIAVVEQLARRHAIPTALLGFALPDDRAHGPDEKFHLPHLELGARTIAALLDELGATPPPSARASLRRERAAGRTSCARRPGRAR